MIVDLIEGEHKLPQYNLGGREPSDEVKQALLKMRVPIRAIWCSDKHRWLLYRIKDTNLHFQREAPEGDLTTGITEWLGKFDDTEHGRWGDEDRVKRWADWFEFTRLSEERKERAARIKEKMYEVRHINKWLARTMGGNKQVVVPEGPPVALVKQKDGSLMPVRRYKK